MVEAPPAGSWLSRLQARLRRELGTRGLHRAGLFLRLTLHKAHRDAIGLTSGALAFVTVLSLVPLLAAFSFLGARFFSQYQEQLLRVLVQILPYSEDALVSIINEFLRQAEQVQGLGALFFIISTLAAFSQVEEAINRIWEVRRQRPLRERLLSFTLLLFWGPLLISASFSVLLYLRQRTGLESLLATPWWLAVVTPAILLLGLTMLYWLVPYAPVRFRSALFGGFVATTLLECLRHGFRVYIENVNSLNLVYGGFAFALLFMISIQGAWLAVLAGSELAYTSQHFTVMARMWRQTAPISGPWLGLIALTKLADRLQQGEPVVAVESLAQRLKVPIDPLRGSLAPLFEAGLVQETSLGLVLARPIHQLPVMEVLQCYEPLRHQLLTAVSHRLSTELERLRERLEQARADTLGGLHIAQLLEAAGNGNGEEEKTSAQGLVDPPSPG